MNTKDLVLSIIHATGGNPKRADEAASVLQSVYADHQEIMRINNDLCVALLGARQFINDLRLDGTGEPARLILSQIDAVVR